MADAVTGAAGKAAMSMFGPHPSITIVTFWQGIVEIIGRIVALVLAFIMLITAGVALNDLGYDDFEGLDNFGKLGGEDWEWEHTANLSRGACGFLVFIILVLMIVEGIIIALRFLNLGIMDRFTFIFHIVDIVISGVYALLFLCLAFPTAVYSNLFRRYESECDDLVVEGIRCSPALDDGPGDLDEDLGAVSFFCFVGVLVFAGLAVFMGIGLMLRWRNTQTKYAIAVGSVGGGPE